MKPLYAQRLCQQVRRALHPPADASQQHELRKVLAITDCLAQPPGAGRTHATRQALNAFPDTAISDDPPAARLAPGQPPRPQQTAVRMPTLLAKGAVSRAAQNLSALPVKTFSESVLEEMQECFPAEDPLTAEELAYSPEGPDLPAKNADTFRAVLTNLKRGKAAGPSGTTYEHIRSACLFSSTCFDAVHDFIYQIATDQLELPPDYTDCLGIPLEKPNGKLRPICVGEVWLRIAAIYLLALHGKLGQDLAPKQLGVEVSGGAEAIGHALNAALEAEPDTAVVSLDWRNAFNCLLRREMVSAVRARVPTLLPFVRTAYGRPSRVFVQGAPVGTDPIMCASGVRQGDPLGPLLFAITLQGPLEEVSAAHPDANLLAYMDDTYAHGRPSALPGAITALQAAGAKVGLELVPQKCQVYGHPDAQGCNAAAASVAAQLGFRHADTGFIACGTPIGTDEYIRRHVEEKVGETTRLVDALCALPDPLTIQDKFVVLHYSLQRKLAHLPRTLPWHLIEAQFQSFTSHLCSSALSLFGIAPDAAASPSPHSMLAQLTLPLRHGGFDIFSHDASTAAAAFLSSAAKSDCALAAGPAVFRRLVDTASTPSPCATQWHSLLQQFPQLSPDSGDALAAADLHKVVAAQSVVHRLVGDSRAAALRASLPHQRDQARLHSVSSAPGSAWLQAIPYHPTLCIPDFAFQIAAKLRLGATALFPTAPAAPCPSCRCPLQGNDLVHALSCNHRTGPWHRRHDLINAALRRVARRAGCPSTAEQYYDALGSDSGTKCRGDSSILVTPGPDRVAADVSATCPLAGSYLRAAQSPGGAARQREQMKIRHFRQHGQSGLAFRPFVVESYGYLGSEAMRLLRELASAGGATGRISRARFLAHAFQEISVANCVGNAQVVRAGLDSYVRVSGRCFMAGLEVPTDDIC